MAMNRLHPEDDYFAIVKEVAQYAPRSDSESIAVRVEKRAAFLGFAVPAGFTWGEPYRIVGTKELMFYLVNDYGHIAPMAWMSIMLIDCYDYCSYWDANDE